MNKYGEGKYSAFSAGSQPAGAINPLTLKTLESHGHFTGGLRPKSLDEFRDQSFDLVVTVCDRARESCPVWPANTEFLHWSFPDPAAFEGSAEEKETFFDSIYLKIEKKILSYLGAAI